MGQDDGGPNVFVRGDAIEGDNCRVLQAGDHVSFWVTEAKRGLKAIHVWLFWGILMNHQKSWDPKVLIVASYLLFHRFLHL
ncbi:MAG: cold shock domain-containing protein [Desulfobaccales bacterium]